MSGQRLSCEKTGASYNRITAIWWTPTFHDIRLHALGLVEEGDARARGKKERSCPDLGIEGLQVHLFLKGVNPLSGKVPLLVPLKVRSSGDGQKAQLSVSPEV